MLKSGNTTSVPQVELGTELFQLVNNAPYSTHKQVFTDHARTLPFALIESVPRTSQLTSGAARCVTIKISGRAPNTQETMGNSLRALRCIALLVRFSFS
jgi:hypothetical protein